MNVKKEDIAKGNDLLRRTLMGGQVMITRIVQESPYKDEIINKVRGFNNFTEGDDPYEEHDFGVVEVDKGKYYFKIDYYDKNYEYGVDPHKDKIYRVLTIMHSSEY